MHPKNKISEHDRERLDSELNQIFLAALQIELADLDQTARQLKNLAQTVDAMSGHVQALRGKWYPGADDAPGVNYRPAYEIRKEIRP